MSIFTPPRHELVDRALQTTRQLCGDDTIDGSTVLRHAVGVVLNLEKHVQPVDEQTAAGILLHDTPYSDKVTTDELDVILRDQFGLQVHRIVRTIEQEHERMGSGPGLNDQLQRHIAELVLDQPVLLATAADKITAFGSFMKRANDAADPTAFWASKPAFTSRMPYFVAFAESVSPHIPQSMAQELTGLVSEAQNRIPQSLGSE